MKTESKFYKSIGILALITAVLLLIPLIAMQFSSGVVWTFSDFIIAGALLFGTGFAYILVTRILAVKMAGNIIYRVAIGFSLFSGLFLIWANGAVGIIGSENINFNELYFGVIAIGIIGAFMARFQAKGLCFTMFAMAFAQALIATIALFIGMQHLPFSSVVEILNVNGFFIMLFVVSALLFRQAAEEQTSSSTKTEV